MSMHDEHDHERTLSDADVEAIAAALERRMTERFHVNVGRGVLGLAWKAVLLGILALAAYGAGRGHGF